jgi:hypothetical protein
MNNMLICWKRENNMATVKLRFSCESSPGHSVYFPFLYFLTTAGLCSALISDVKLQTHRAIDFCQLLVVDKSLCIL